MILLIDNYDSFTYNIYDYLRQCRAEVALYRSDAISIADIAAMKPAGIVISPGPGKPADYPLLQQVMQTYAEQIPILGICLGHQAIGEYYGGRLHKGPVPAHGKVCRITHYGHEMYRNIPPSLQVTRYHSLIISALENTVLEPTAHSPEGIVMSLAHKRLPVWGIQFHPEAILTEYGLQMLKNWTALF